MRPWIIGAVAWLVLAMITAAQQYTFLAYIGRPMEPWMAVWRELIMFGTWAALTPPIVMLTRRARRSRAWHIPACIATSLAHNAMLVGARYLIETDELPPFSEQLVHMLGRYFILDVIFYAAIVGVVEAALWADAYRRREADLARARLDALRGQLQPHFLFNALHAASSLIDTDPVAARRTIVRLSDLLRATLDIERPVVSLADELVLLDRYLDIQRVRFADRLSVAIDVPVELRTAAVPPLILQPLVENAIRHGIGTRPEAGTIAISARRDGDHLRLVVSDNGIGLSESRTERVGLGTTRARLEALHGDAAFVTLRDRTGGGAETIVELPWVTA